MMIETWTWKDTGEHFTIGFDIVSEKLAEEGEYDGPGIYIYLGYRTIHIERKEKNAR